MRNKTVLTGLAMALLLAQLSVAQPQKTAQIGGGVPIAHAMPAPRSAPQPVFHGSAPFTHQGARPVSQGGTHVFDEGIWTSAGYLPTHNGQGQQSYGHDRNRHAGYGYGVVGYPVYAYPTAYVGGLNGGLNLDEGDPYDPNNQAAAAPNVYVDSESGPPPGLDYPAYDAARIPYTPAYTQPENDNAYGQLPKSDGLGHPKVTLIFKDGRQPLLVQNYAMTQTRIFVRDNGTERDIAIGDLDVQATLAANDQAGVDFALPVSR